MRSHVQNDATGKEASQHLGEACDAAMGGGGFQATPSGTPLLPPRHGPLPAVLTIASFDLVRRGAQAEGEVFRERAFIIVREGIIVCGVRLRERGARRVAKALRRRSGAILRAIARCSGGCGIMEQHEDGGGE